MPYDIAPRHIHFMGSAEIRTAPNVEGIGICPITGAFTVAQDLLYKVVVKEVPNKIAAFFAVRVVCKECGNLYPMVF